MEDGDFPELCNSLPEGNLIEIPELRFYTSQMIHGWNIWLHLSNVPVL